MLANTFLHRKTAHSSCTFAAVSIRLKSHQAVEHPRTNQVNPAETKVTSASLQSTARKPSLINVRDVPAPHVGVIRTLSLNNPRSRNAISKQLLKELANEVHMVETEEQKRMNGTMGHGWGVRALIVDSACDEAFCAGADLKERRNMTQEETSHFLISLRSTFTAIANLAVPTISAVSSIAYGGGFELALSTTFRVFASTASVSLPETSLGIIPGAGGTYRLARLIGQARAMQMILSGERVQDMSSAHRIGLCDYVVDINSRKPDEAQGSYREDASTRSKQTSLSVARVQTAKAAMKVANIMCNGAPLATAAAMRAVRGASPEAENAAYESVIRTEDRNAALVAFAEKRTPVFKGR